MSKRRKDLQREAESFGRPAIVLDADAVIRLLRAKVDLEGGQTAFARRHGVDRSHVNMLLNGKRRDVGGAIIKALGCARCMRPNKTAIDYADTLGPLNWLTAASRA